MTFQAVNHSESWELKPLGEVCDFRGGGTPSTKVKKFWEGNIPWVSPKDMKSKFVSDSMDHLSSEAIRNSAASLIPKGSVLIVVRSGILARIVPLAISTRDLTINQDLKALCPHKSINLDFLYYFLEGKMDVLLSKVSRGATVHRLTTDLLRQLPIPVPPLPEQKRIVAILDGAFAAIAKAKENAEKNLRNAKELFESFLQGVFANPGEGWEAAILSDLSTDITDGDHMPPPKSTSGIPFITISNIDKSTNRIDFSDTFLVSSKYYENLKPNRKPRLGDILYTVTGSFGIPVLIEDDTPFCFQRHIGLIRPKESLLPKLLYYWAKSPQAVTQANDTATGTAQKTVSLKALRNFSIPLIPLPEQKHIVAKLDVLSAETRKLEAIYKQKFVDLDELKKSILQKAFSGELSKDFAISNVLPFPVSIPNISVTDLHAGILAITYQAHESKGTQRTFGHVKAEKIAHMVENWVGIDLGRKPVKDAAGPNDFKHLHNIESRAKKASFFYFKKTSENAYQFIPGRQIESVIQRTKQALGEKYTALESLLELMVKMDTKQAEIFATVFAAWNNLLLAGTPLTEEDIVVEARENWHPEKLKIPRDRFFEAIKWMKEKGIVPMGKGKMVQAKKAV